jgi:TonB family protein
VAFFYVLSSAAPPLIPFRDLARLVFLVWALSLNSCSRRPPPPITSINDETARPPSGAHQTPFLAAAGKLRPAVVVLATFDEDGGLIANEHAVFVSANGDLLAERSAMNNAASAVVKGGDGHAYDTLGTYVRSSSPNFIFLKTNARNVPHLQNPEATAEVADGAPAAIVLSASDAGPAPFIEGRIAGHKNDEDGEWLAFDPSPPKSALGAPVVDVRGAIVGIVAQRNGKDNPAIFRYTGTPSVVAAEVARTEEGSATSPAEGPPEENTPPEISSAPKPASSPPAMDAPHLAEIDLNKLQPEPITPAPAATAGKFFIRMNPNWHIHSRDRPQTPSPQTSTGENASAGKLVYTPLPRYRLGGNTKRGGDYRLTFNAQGNVTNVEVARSAGSSALDNAAIGTLRSWRAEPGREWSVIVPVTFR